eukprot:TRINITY_DN19848_c0_g1_i1.p1 TRINITY_DN19848_c0_g1~~TRINITY_DN19848_c0_g1_i1.p1  ORF type:complete len:327 (+),score=26.89 TRINITY_DN19848_c0_g1_i1:92-982(+)
MSSSTSVTVVFPHRQGEIGLQQRASIVVQTNIPGVPQSITIQAVDTFGELVKLCPKQKKDHEFVLKTLNEELFQGGAKGDVTFYCKGANSGGCKTKKPSRIRLLVTLHYEGCCVDTYSSYFMVKGNRRTQTKIFVKGSPQRPSSPTLFEKCVSTCWSPHISNCSSSPTCPTSISTMFTSSPSSYAPFFPPSVVLARPPRTSRIREDTVKSIISLPLPQIAASPISFPIIPAVKVEWPRNDESYPSAFSRKRTFSEIASPVSSCGSPLKKMNINHLVNEDNVVGNYFSLFQDPVDWF